MTDSIESAVQQLISKVEASQALIDDLESQVRQLQLREAELQRAVDEKDSALQRAVDEKDSALQRAVDEKDSELQKLVREKVDAENRISELNQAFEQQAQSLTAKVSEVKAASAESESALLHLQQVQEELEYYFLLNQKKSKMLESFEGLNHRMAVLVSNLSAKP